MLSGAGSKVGILGGTTGPTLSRLIDQWVAAVGVSKRVVYEPYAFESLIDASRSVFGVGGRPVFDLSGADFVIDFGAESMESWLSPVEHARQIEEARQVSKSANHGARLIYVGPRLSTTAGNADEWLPAKPGSEGILALAIARVAFDRARSRGRPVGGDPALIGGVLARFSPEAVASQTEIPAETIRRGQPPAAERPVARHSSDWSWSAGVGADARGSTSWKATDSARLGPSSAAPSNPAARRSGPTGWTAIAPWLARAFATNASSRGPIHPEGPKSYRSAIWSSRTSRPGYGELTVASAENT